MSRRVDIVAAMKSAARELRAWQKDHGEDMGSAAAIASLREAAPAYVALVAAALRVTEAFRAHGRASGIVDNHRTRQECEDAMLALDEALRPLAEAAP